MSILSLNCENLQNNPRCPHGPTLKFTKLVKGKPKSFFACSACRDRKDCPFFLWEDERITESKLLMWKDLKNKIIPKIDHKQIYNRYKDFKKLESNRQFCLSCYDFIFPTDKSNHQSHNIKHNVTNEELDHPTKILFPITDSKKEAQFWFSDKSKKFILNNIVKKTDQMLCVGTPTIHELLRDRGIHSILLDIDHRYHWFYDAHDFFWFNMFNAHFMDNNKLTKKRLKAALNHDKIAVIIDPPFGARIEPLEKTINILQKDSPNKFLIMLILPYFMEPQVLASFSDFIMLDFAIEYINHRKFKNKGCHNSVKSSPIRIFTNIPPKEFIFPENEGYHYCKICEAWRSELNRHCKICETCPSKNRESYEHCKQCKKCVKKTWIHCAVCKKCVLRNHSCVNISFNEKTCRTKKKKRKF